MMRDKKIGIQGEAPPDNLVKISCIEIRQLGSPNAIAATISGDADAAEDGTVSQLPKVDTKKLVFL